MTTSTNYPSPKPHQCCPLCKENLRRDPRADVTKPATFVCGEQCARKYGIRPEEQPTFLDGGTDAGRARLREAEEAQAAQLAVRNPRTVPLKCKALGCELTLEIPVTFSAERIQANLRAAGWTPDGCCSIAHSASLPRSPAPPSSAAAPTNEAVARAAALGRQRRGELAWPGDATWLAYQKTAKAATKGAR